MSFGSFPGDNDDDEVMSEINMTPLVDVMLVLLIIFMITMPVLTHAVKMELPRAASQPVDARPPHIVLGIDAAGAYTWDQEIVSREVLAQRLAVAAQQQPQPELHIHADKAVVYDAVAQALAATQRAGLAKVGFVSEATRPQVRP